MHISFGQFHGGVVCNDIYTNYEFVPMSSSHQEILIEIKDFLFKYWDTLERGKTDSKKEILEIYQQYYDWQKEIKLA